MNCIIIDDEPLAREGMQMHILNYPKLNLLGSFSNTFDASDVLKNNTIDLIFLDINMPEMNGLDFVKSLTRSPMIVFATAYPQYAIDSYELDAVDYLLKPIRFERFVKAVNKAQDYYNILHPKTSENNQIESINDDFIYIKADRKFFKIFFNDILYIEGLKDYVIIHTNDNKVVTAMNLKTIFDKLSKTNFARISKSNVVNINHILSFDVYYVYMKNNAELPLGNIFKDDFIKNFVDGKVLKK
jgi:DNA-binding LytR/AlgR family response regulator